MAALGQSGDGVVDLRKPGGCAPKTSELQFSGLSFLVDLLTSQTTRKEIAMKIQSVFRCMTLIITLVFSTHGLAETIWIDVRSELERKMDSIEGDLRISHSDIVPEVQKLFPDKNTEIKLYCRGGGRAGEAATALENAGYTYVESIGGIDDARKYRGIEP